jgi:hypothetical protein
MQVSVMAGTVRAPRRTVPACDDSGCHAPAVQQRSAGQRARPPRPADRDELVRVTGAARHYPRSTTQVLRPARSPTMSPRPEATQRPPTTRSNCPGRAGSAFRRPDLKPYSAQVQQRQRPRAALRDFHRPLACPNDFERPSRREFASRGATYGHLASDLGAKDLAGAA